MNLEALFGKLVRYIAEVVNLRDDFHPEPGGYTTFSYHNTCGRDIAVMDRNNDVHIIPHSLGGHDLSNPGLRIKVIRNNASFGAATVTQRALETTTRALGRSNPSIQSSLLCAKSARKDDCGRFYTERAFDIGLDVILSEKAVLEENTGLMILPLELIGQVIHPDSSLAREYNRNRGYVNGRPTGRMIEIIDNNSQYKERFAFMCNEVVRIPAIRDSERVEGVHVSVVQDVGMDTSRVDMRHYTFEEGFKRFGLFGTREEAENAGNPELAFKHEIEKLDRENKLLAHKLKTAEIEHNRQLLDAKKGLEHQGHTISTEELEIKREEQRLRLERLEIERQERLAQFEREQEVARFKSITFQAEEEARRRKTLEDAQAASYSSSMKSTAESFKWMPAIVAGTLAVGAGVAAFFFRS